MIKKNLLVSSCLIGLDCRYCGPGYNNEEVLKLKEKYNLIPVCPEQMGGLPTPRIKVELIKGKAFDSAGADVTLQFKKGANEVVKLAKIFKCSCALLKSKSPSCGCGKIYDGTFSGNLVKGNGITTEKLLKEGIRVVNEDNIGDLKSYE